MEVGMRNHCSPQFHPMRLIGAMYCMGVFILIFVSGCGSTLPVKGHREYRETVVGALDSGSVDSSFPDEVLAESWRELSVTNYRGREMRSYVKFPMPVLEKGETVESVGLNAKLNGIIGTVFPIWIGIHGTTNDWKGSELTWNQQPGFEEECLGIMPYYAGEPGLWIYWELNMKGRNANNEYLSFVMVLEEEVPSKISFDSSPSLIFVTYR